jgi:hypothetical protein
LLGGLAVRRERAITPAGVIKALQLSPARGCEATAACMVGASREREREDVRIESNLFIPHTNVESG